MWGCKKHSKSSTWKQSKVAKMRVARTPGVRPTAHRRNSGHAGEYEEKTITSNCLQTQNLKKGIMGPQRGHRTENGKTSPQTLGTVRLIGLRISLAVRHWMAAFLQARIQSTREKHVQRVECPEDPDQRREWLAARYGVTERETSPNPVFDSEKDHTTARARSTVHTKQADRSDPSSLQQLSPRGPAEPSAVVALPDTEVPPAHSNPATVKAQSAHLRGRSGRSSHARDPSELTQVSLIITRSLKRSRKKRSLSQSHSDVTRRCSQRRRNVEPVRGRDARMHREGWLEKNRTNIDCAVQGQFVLSDTRHGTEHYTGVSDVDPPARSSRSKKRLLSHTRNFAPPPSQGLAPISQASKDTPSLKVKRPTVRQYSRNTRSCCVSENGQDEDEVPLQAVPMDHSQSVWQDDQHQVTQHVLKDGIETVSGTPATPKTSTTSLEIPRDPHADALTIQGIEESGNASAYTVLEQEISTPPLRSPSPSETGLDDSQPSASTNSSSESAYVQPTACIAHPTRAGSSLRDSAISDPEPAFDILAERSPSIPSQASFIFMPDEVTSPRPASVDTATHEPVAERVGTANTDRH